GQTIVLEDLETVLNTIDMNRLKKYIVEGKIEIGPWYILPDEFLTDEASYLENFNQGRRIVERFNGNSKGKIGYLPDTFGHISQIPQILHFNQLNNALIHRGTTTDKLENNWYSPDGSKVETIVLPLRDGYYQTFF